MDFSEVVLGIAALALVCAASAVAEAPFPKALDRAAVTLATLDEPINDALILGNGDLNGLLFAEGDDLVVRVTKNDVWDARLDAPLNPPLPTLARLKELGAGPWPDRNWILPEGTDTWGLDAYHAHAYPCPRACAVIRISGAARAPLVAKLDLARARADVYADAGRTGVFAAADANVFILDGPAAAAIEPILSSDIPEPTTGADAGCSWILQEIPGDPDWPGLSFAVACRSVSNRSAVAVVTSLEAADPRAEAVALATRAVERDPAEVEQAHIAGWGQFWSRSGIAIADELLERTWYRNLYFLRCVSKPGVVSTGLFAGLLDDKPAWHGDYHTNYNIQQTYWGAYASNHADLTEPYDRLITEYLPRARWLAKAVFDCGGAYFPHVLFAYEPPDPEACAGPHGRQYIHHVWGMTLGVNAFTVQPLWWHYKFEPDRDYLEHVAYPAVRDVAVFYADFADTCERRDGRIVLAPTVSPEHHGWTPNFERNRNDAFCIAYFHFAFDAAIEAAARLEVDPDLVERWRAAKALLPDYPLFETPDGSILVDVEGAPPITYNIPVPTTPVFPADQIAFDSAEATRDLFARTLQHLEHNGNNAPIMLAMARARLDAPDAHDWLRTELERRERRNGTLSFNRLDPRFRFNDFGHYTEMFGAVWPITELLVQSVGDTIRLFPSWPQWLDARFERLRAQGGFLVSAEYSGGTVKNVTVESPFGGTLRLVLPMPACELRSGDAGPWRSIEVDDRGIVAFEMAPGGTLAFRARPIWRSIRAQGRLNAFERTDDASAMRIAGNAEASTGYAMDGIDVANATALEFELRGTPNARYFVEACTSNGTSVTGWRPSPEAPTRDSLELPANAELFSVTLYTMTVDGAEAVNLFRSLTAVADQERHEIDLTTLKP